MLNLNVLGRQIGTREGGPVTAQFKRDGQVQATWPGSLFLAMAANNGLFSLPLGVTSSNKKNMSKL